MASLEEIFQNPAYRHVVLNHLPLTGLFVAWIVLVVGVFARQRAISLLGLVLVAVTAGSVLLVMPAGEDAYPLVYETLDGAGRERLDRHADLAGVWGLGLYATAGLALVALVLSVVRQPLTTVSSAVVGLATLLSLGGAFIIAEAGGEIRHPGFRHDHAPVASENPMGGPVAMRRLNAEQYRGAISDVFGEEIEVVGRFEPEVRREGLLAVGSAQTTMTPAGVEQYESMATGVASQVLAEPNRAELVLCEPSSLTAPDDACAEEFLRSTGAKLFRRELAEEEVASRVEVARQVALENEDFYLGLEIALASLLVSPDFLFRVERTEAEPGRDDRARLTDDTLATRLSYLIWNAAPDDELREVAERGELSDPVVLQAQVDRLLASPRAREGVRAFFADLLRFDEIDEITKDLGRYPIYSRRMARDAREQTLRVIVDHVVDRQEDYRDLFTTRRSFVTRSLGPIYGVPVRSAEGWEELEFPDGHPRAGLLSHASINMLHAHPGRSSPTLRGLFLREALLCQIVPPAPAGVEFALFNDDQNPDRKTARDRLEVHSSNASCRSCHKLTDPIGLGLEHFDGIGKVRKVENGASIDVSGSLDGTRFDDAVGLGEAFRNHPRLTECLVEMLYRYAVGREATAGEAGILEDLQGQFTASEYRILALLRAIALSETFQTAPAVEAAQHQQVQAATDLRREDDA